MGLVYGVGINDGKYKATDKDNKKTKEYTQWQDMIRRCYSDKLHSKRPTYIGCTASDYFKSYSNFYEWCQNQIGFNVDGFQLDKDILIKGNKLYSEDTCVFVPPHINALLTKSNSARGSLPIGVDVSSSKSYMARNNANGKREYLGCHKTTNDAFLAYKRARESYIKEVANKYRDQIDPRAYDALMNYNIDIND